MSVLAIMRVELRRFLRERSNLFFVFVLPLMLVVFIGAQFAGGAAVQLGLVADRNDAVTQQFVATLVADGDVEIVEYTDVDELTNAVSRARLSAGIVMPAGLSTHLAELTPVEISFVGRPDARAQALRALVATALETATAPFEAANVALQATGGTNDGSAISAEALIRFAEIHGDGEASSVVMEAIGGDELAREFAGLGQFDLGASSQLFLFVFLTSLASSAALIQTRQLGVARRMLSTPTTTGRIIAGQASGRLVVALTQALYIIVATTLLFRVNWGSPMASGLVVLAFCLVAAAAGMLVGSVFRNDAQASGIGVGAGLGLAALGGSMVPLEVFPDAMQRVALITPHAWANQAMATIVRRDGGVIDVVTEVSVLFGYALALGVVATIMLRRALTR